jgi:hypothetical protein
MLVFDFTAEAAPVIYAMIGILLMSAAGVAVEPTVRVLRNWFHTIQPRLSIRRAALGHSR